jgi:hypothetical protein
VHGLNGPPSFDDRWLLVQAYQRHILQAAFADRLLGHLITRLKQKGLYDRALVVVTADNGEAFLHHADRHEATPENVHEIAATPLIIKAPGQRRGRLDDRSARTLDVLPTIADLLRVRLPWPVQGRSIWRRPARLSHRVEFVQRSGDRLVLPFANFKRRLQSSLARKWRLFGSNGGQADMYGIGPHPELVGRQIVPSVRRRLTATIAGASAFRSVVLRSGFLPALITGHISGPGRRGSRDIAIAINGRIVATAPTFELADSRVENFSVLVPETSFRDGGNRVQLLWIRGSPTAPDLTLIGQVG